MGRGDPKSGTRWPGQKIGRDVQVPYGFGATSPGTRMVPYWLVWRLYKPKSETKPIQYVASKIKKCFCSEKSSYQGPKCPVTLDASFHDLNKLLNNFLSL